MTGASALRTWHHKPSFKIAPINLASWSIDTYEKDGLVEPGGAAERDLDLLWLVARAREENLRLTRSRAQEEHAGALLRRQGVAGAEEERL